MAMRTFPPFSGLLIACFTFLAWVVAPVADAQFGARKTIISGAKVHTVSGRVLEGVDILMSGKTIKAIGMGLAASAAPNVTVVDAKGKVVIPGLVDASSVLGLDTSAPRTQRAWDDVRDRINLYDREPILDALNRGVCYVYLRGGVTGSSGVSGQGVALVLPRRSRDSDKQALYIAGSEALHMKVQDSSGALSSLSNIKALEKKLEASRKYQESWKKYEEDLKKYVDALKKGKDPKADKSGKPERSGKPAPKPAVVPPKPVKDDKSLSGEATPPVEKVPLSVIGPFPHPCPVCGGDSHEETDHDKRAFDFWEFERLVLDDPPKPGVKAPAKGKPADSKAKKPRRPRHDPTSVQIVRALEGKLRVRIEVHKAADILNLLGVLEKFPMNAALEGVTEGHLVAKELAKAGYPVILRCAPEKPEQERGNTASQSSTRQFIVQGGRVIRIPSRSSSGASSPPRQGSPRNAVILDEAGVPVVISSFAAPRTATPQLLASAAWASSHGLSEKKALEAITSQASRVLGMDKLVGSIEVGRRASLLILSGDLFAATTRVEAVYIDGRKF